MNSTKKFKTSSFLLVLTLISSSLILIKSGFNSFPIQFNDNISYFLSILFTLILLIFTIPYLKRKHLIDSILKSPFYFLFLSTICIQYIFHLLFGLSEIYSVAKLFSFISVGFYFYYVFPLLIKIDYKYLKIWMKYLLYFSVFCSIIAILGVFEFNPFFEWNTFDEKFYLFMTLRSTASILFEPNIFAYLLLISFAINDIIIKNLKLKYLLAIILISGLIFSYSRGAWLCIFAYIFLKFFFKSKYKFSILVITIISLLTLSIFFISNPLLVEILMLDNPLTGRLFLWQESIKLGLENFMWGFGFSNDRINNFFLKLGFNYTTSHNIFIDMYLFSGIFGTIFYMLAFIFPLTKFRLQSDNNKIKFLSLSLAILLFLQFSPHNIGGASFSAISTAIIFGFMNLNYQYER